MRGYSTKANADQPREGQGVGAPKDSDGRAALPPRTLAEWLRSPRHAEVPAVTGHLLGGAPIPRNRPEAPADDH